MCRLNLLLPKPSHLISLVVLQSFRLRLAFCCTRIIVLYAPSSQNQQSSSQNLQRLMIPDLLDMNGISMTRIGVYDAPYESYIWRSRWRIVATNLFSLCVFQCGRILWGFFWLCDLFGKILTLPFVLLSHRTPIPVILYLYSFDFRTIPGYLRFFGAGVRGERLFVDKKIQERKSQQQLIKLEQANDSTWIETIQSHTTSLSVWTIYSSVPLMKTRAKVSIEMTSDQFALEHMPLSLLSTMGQQEETRMYCKIK